MRTLLWLVVSLISVSAFAADRFKIITPKELDVMLQKPSDIFIFDVNVDSTREHVGIVPGAVPIDSASNYNLKVTLPADPQSRLVFYCANEMCSSSHEAANRALDAGYKNVSVMTAGIYGWKKAGLKLSPFHRKGAAQGAPSNIEPAEAKELVAQNHAVIIDVREGEERHEIISGERWFPMSKAKDLTAWTEFKASLPKDKTIIIHCASGFRSKKIAEKLTEEGVSSLYFKGVDQWKDAGLPLVPGPAL